MKMKVLVVVVGLVAVILLIWVVMMSSELKKALVDTRLQEVQAVKGRMLHDAVFQAIARGEEVRRFVDKDGRRCLNIQFVEEQKQLTYCLSTYGIESSVNLYLPDFK